jgi:hypothetical protein
LQDVFAQTGIHFVFILDEWDCLFRERKEDKTAQNKYLDFLRDLLKDASYVALVYMTGILPIKKTGTHSGLNMFDEHTMTNPHRYARFVGFTQDEVEPLCGQYGMDYDEMSRWYNGYRFTQVKAVYSPRSVVSALLHRSFKHYWNQTETYEALKTYIEMDFKGLKDSVVQLLAGGKIRIDVNTFSNDMVTFASSDDVLTLLVHLGYLGYDAETEKVFIPNKEISDEFITATKSADWDEALRGEAR